MGDLGLGSRPEINLLGTFAPIALQPLRLEFNSRRSSSERAIVCAYNRIDVAEVRKKASRYLKTDPPLYSYIWTGSFGLSTPIKALQSKGFRLFYGNVSLASALANYKICRYRVKWNSTKSDDLCKINHLKVFSKWLILQTKFGGDGQNWTADLWVMNPSL